MLDSLNTELLARPALALALALAWAPAPAAGTGRIQEETPAPMTRGTQGTPGTPGTPGTQEPEEPPAPEVRTSGTPGAPEEAPSLPVPTPEELDEALGELFGDAQPTAPAGEPSEADLREKDYFTTCDHDGNGWISYREARISLGIDRPEYALYDRDRDGRVQPSEFHERYAFTVERTGGFQPPKAPPQAPPPERRTAGQLRNVYDRNNDLALDVKELAVLLEEYRVDELTAPELLALHDVNGSGKLETLFEPEARSLEHWLDQVIGGRFWNLPEESATTVEELFGQVVERDVAFGGVPLPPQIVGPVPHFRRLDLDGDGFITVQDLTTLQAPLQLGVRASTVLASLDLDGDGRLSETEFLTAMQISLR